MSRFSPRQERKTAPGAASSALQNDDMPAPGRLPLVGALLFALLAEALLGIALALGPTNGSSLALLELGDLVISGLFALGSCLLAGLAMRGRERSAWMLLGIAALGGLMTQGARLFAVQGIANLAPSSGSGSLSLSTLVLTGQSVLLFLGFLAFPPPLQQRFSLGRLRQFFDGLLVVGAALVGALYFILVPLYEHGAADHSAIVAISAGDLLVLVGLTFALRAAGTRREPLRASLRVLAFAGVLLIAADAASAVQMLDQPVSLTSPLQALWNAAYLCLGLAALLRMRGESQAEEAREANGEEHGANFWQGLPFLLVVLMAGAIVYTTVTDGTGKQRALVGLALLVALVGVRYLIGVVESRHVTRDNQLIARELALTNEELDRLRAEQLSQAQQRQQSVLLLQDVLARFGYGEYEARAQAADAELASLARSLNALLDGIEEQFQDRDRRREFRVMGVLVEAIGRLALGELHDLPDLPPPTGSPLDAIMKGVIQLRTRLLNLQSAMQQHEAERHNLEQQVTTLHHHLSQETQGEQQALLQLNQSLEGQLQQERQVAQAAEEQAQRAEAQLREAEARAREAEAALASAEEQLRRDYATLERRVSAERQDMEQRLSKAPQLDLTRSARLRQRGEELAGQVSGQSERITTAAVALKTAAEVARRLAKHLEETMLLPELRSTEPTPAPIPVPPAPPVSPPPSALQLLEQLAGIKPSETAPTAPAVSGSLAPALRSPSGTLDGKGGEQIVRRLRMAASRCEEMAGGLLDLAEQLMAEGEASQQVADEAGQLAAELGQLTPAPTTFRAIMPARTPKT